MKCVEQITQKIVENGKLKILGSRLKNIYIYVCNNPESLIIHSHKAIHYNNLKSENMKDSRKININQH